MNDAVSLSTVAELIARLVREYPDLPPVAAVSMTRTSHAGLTAALQMYSVGELPAMVTEVSDWASALDCIVTMEVNRAYTWIGAQAQFGGHRVTVWNHLSPADTDTMFTALGMPDPTRGTHVEVSPAALLRAVAATSAAVA
jgi:hypothetical protein